MNKKLFLLPILLLIPQITHSWFWDQSVDEYLEQEYDYTETKHAKSEVNGETVRRIAQQELERILKPGEQNSSNKREVRNYINKASTEIKNTIMKMSVLSQQEANKLAVTLAHDYDYAPEFLGAKSAKMTRSRVNRSMPVNPEWLAKKGLTKRDIERDISNTIKKQAKQELARNNTLYALVGSLETRIENELERIYRPYLDDYHPSRPAASDEIVELYPQTSTSLNEYHVKLAQLKEFREESCCVCAEDFGKNINRVNLLCGHTICTNCLHGWMYQSGQHNAKTCPMCRASIKTEDYPSRFLEKHFH